MFVLQERGDGLWPVRRLLVRAGASGRGAGDRRSDGRVHSAQKSTPVHRNAGQLSYTVGEFRGLLDGCSETSLVINSVCRL